jgi:hypothetical protein
MKGYRPESGHKIHQFLASKITAHNVKPLTSIEFKILRLFLEPNFDEIPGQILG